MQSFEANLSDAIEAVSAWDLPDEDFADSVNDRARLMAGIQQDEPWCFDSDSPTH
jgi:hypothetical protein